MQLMVSEREREGGAGTRAVKGTFAQRHGRCLGPQVYCTGISFAVAALGPGSCLVPRARWFAGG
jgi:hypothetical protein